jgi:hypothetical protein
MSAESMQTRAGDLHRLTRVDRAKAGRLPLPAIPSLFAPILAVMAGGLVLLGAGNLDLGPADARVGLAAGAGIGPLGQVYGNWAPDLWPGRVMLSQLSRLFEERGVATPASVLWPAALAAVAIGWLLARRLANVLGLRAGLWFGLCWFGCLGVIDHSGGTGLDFLAGLAIVAAIDRLLGHGSDWIAGLWTSLAFLMGGWPPVLLILLAVIVIGRHEARFSLRLLLPPAAAAVLWSTWTLTSAPTEVWAAAITLPFTRHPSWWLAPGVLALGMPLAPLAMLAAGRPMRDSWSTNGRQTVAGWFQTAIACALAGTIIPGLSQHAGVPALAGLLVVAATGADAAWCRSLSPSARRFLLSITFGLLLVWLMALVYGGYLWLMVFPYYRPIGIVAVILGVTIFSLVWRAIEMSDSRRAMVALVILTISIKLVHWGYYVPEWNYRYGQGPWGRAIGQWLLPNWTLHTFLDWPEDLAFAIGRPIRRLATPRHLSYEVTADQSEHVLLLESEFDHWPDDAPRLLRVATFLDPSGEKRILARTPGVLITPSGQLNPAGREP